jgi:hypothetical protein
MRKRLVQHPRARRRIGASSHPAPGGNGGLFFALEQTGSVAMVFHSQLRGAIDIKFNPCLHEITELI